MAKKKSTIEQLSELGKMDFGLSHSLYKPIEFTTPDSSKLKPIALSIVEALEPIQSELTRVTGELTKANERTEKAEERAKVAEHEARKANKKTLFVSVLAILIPFTQAWYYDSRNQERDKELALLSSTVKQLHQQLEVLKNEFSKSRIPPPPAKVPLRNIGVHQQKRP
ncbi:hypothetical protein [Spirosoma luteum]|uniref:hypothetical protein n=1 Tax=Spirosoma luteum TaxID=431553 RepID=UPI00038075A4|nr:hypothetical protein [Spirosoma luteum]